MREGEGGLFDIGDVGDTEWVDAGVRSERAFAAREGIVPVRSGAGDVDGDPDGFWGYGGDRAYGGQEFEQGGVRGEPSSWEDREEFDF